MAMSVRYTEAYLARETERVQRQVPGFITLRPFSFLQMALSIFVIPFFIIYFYWNREQTYRTIEDVRIIPESVVRNQYDWQRVSGIDASHSCALNALAWVSVCFECNRNRSPLGQIELGEVLQQGMLMNMAIRTANGVRAEEGLNFDEDIRPHINLDELRLDVRRAHHLFYRADDNHQETNKGIILSHMDGVLRERPGEKQAFLIERGGKTYAIVLDPAKNRYTFFDSHGIDHSGDPSNPTPYGPAYMFTAGSLEELVAHMEVLTQAREGELYRQLTFYPITERI